MKKLRQIIGWWQQKTGMWGILGLWVPFFAFFGYIGNGFFFRPLLSMFSGEYFRVIADGYFTRPFNTVHACNAMDQPSIFKFLVLFVFFSVIALTVSIMVRLVSDIRSGKNYFSFAIPYIFILLSALSILVIPATMLAHYICAMGSTPRRIMGCVFIAVCVIIWIAASVAMLWRRRKKEIADTVEMKSGRFYTPELPLE